MNIAEAVAFVIEDQRENAYDIDDMTDLDILQHVRNILSEDFLIEYGEGDLSFDAYRTILRATDSELAEHTN